MRAHGRTHLQVAKKIWCRSSILIIVEVSGLFCGLVVIVVIQTVRVYLLPKTLESLTAGRVRRPRLV